MEQYKSLYEYLGKAAGNELGKKVAAAARTQDIKTSTHEINNPKFAGKVLLYPVSFLDNYFHPTIELKAKEYEDDDLPF
jgi:hypothetical protein